MYAARMAYCGPRGIPLSHFLAWPAPDQEAALAWQAQEARRCSGCGTDPDDWAGDAAAWHVETVLCPGCAKRAGAQADLEHKPKGTTVRLARGAEQECESCAT